jgi:hypothetical protein
LIHALFPDSPTEGRVPHTPRRTLINYFHKSTCRCRSDLKMGLYSGSLFETMKLSNIRKVGR